MVSKATIVQLYTTQISRLYGQIRYNVSRKMSVMTLVTDLLNLSTHICTGHQNYVCPYKQCYIAGSSMCSTKPLSQCLTHILTIIKDGLQRCCAINGFKSWPNGCLPVLFSIIYSRSVVNQMWILKDSKELLETFKSPIYLGLHLSKHMTFLPYTPLFLIQN